LRYLAKPSGRSNRVAHHLTRHGNVTGGRPRIFLHSPIALFGGNYFP
jgi:hypothetical protein